MSGLLRLSLIPALLLIFLLSSCQLNQAPQETINSSSRLKVLFFHTSFRCPTCNAIENNTKKVLDVYFKSQIDSGTLSFSSLSIDKPENKGIVEKYQVSYTSLILIKADTATTDFTYTAFEYAYAKPSKFEELLKAEIEKNLK